MSRPHPGVQARVEQLVAAFRAAHPALPPTAELTAVLKRITAGAPPVDHVLREVWMTALVASAHAADLAEQLEQARATATPPADSEKDPT